MRQQRRIEAAAVSRPQSTSLVPAYTPEEEEILDRIRAGRPWPGGPVAMLSVTQLYTRDFPVLRPPGEADLLQVLWCPFEHYDRQESFPGLALFWRTAAEVTDLLAAPPSPEAVRHWSYVPEPCLLHPEPITEYPCFAELSDGQQERVSQWCRRRAEDAGPDSLYAVDPEGFYRAELSVAPGWKVAGWPTWALTDPIPQRCSACDSDMDPLLTIASAEWDASTSSWIPYEDRGHAGSVAYPDPSHPTMVQIGDENHLQVYACPASPDHPHTELVQ